VERRIKLLDVRTIRSVAFQGERGAFSEQAALEFFRRKIALLPAPTFEDVLKLVDRNEVDSGILPIENSLHGSVLENYDLLQHHRLSIIGEVKLRIVHCLLANHGVELNDLRRVYSHPQALAQCRAFIKRLRNVEAIPAYDTAGAAKDLKEKNLTDAGAIASAQAARDYGLKILVRGIEDNRANFTRFLVLAPKPVSPGTHAKTSVVFTLKNVPGALFDALGVFASRKIDLHKIESRPIVGKPWQYLFYLDFDGSLRDQRCAEATKNLRKVAASVKVLGSYPKAK
jgi:prephenate dehydratase